MEGYEKHKKRLIELAARLSANVTSQEAAETVNKIIDEITAEQQQEPGTLEGRSVTVHANESGERFCLVGQTEIADAIWHELKILVQPYQIRCGDIHELGVYDIPLSIDGKPTIKVRVVQGIRPAKPEKPKVESLREAAIRFFDRADIATYIDAADICAIVLRRVDRLWEWLDIYEASEFFADSPRCHDIVCERAEIKQMLDGSDDREEGE